MQQVFRFPLTQSWCIRELTRRKGHWNSPRVTFSTSILSSFYCTTVGQVKLSEGSSLKEQCPQILDWNRCFSSIAAGCAVGPKLSQVLMDAVAHFTFLM